MNQEGQQQFMSEITQKFWDTLHHNGWKIIMNDDTRDEDYDTYLLSILVQYDVHCYAHIAANEDGMSLDGHLGVLWIDTDYENDEPYDWGALSEMQRGIAYAEENLLAIGVPFTAGYQFHGGGSEWKEERNQHIRKSWGLDEAENKIRSGRG